MKSIFRIIVFFVILIVFCLVGLLIYMFAGQAPDVPNIVFGITFSQTFAEKMGLDWPKAYLAMLDDLKVRKLRLIAYWPKIEPKQKEYYFADLDWQIFEAAKRGAEVILVIGRKLPRWPECHIPDWAKNLSESEQQEQLLLFLTEIVNHYQGNKTIRAWQVENEPFLKGFGRCPKLDKRFLSQEIALVRQLDFSQRPIIVSASGELSSWIRPAWQADILGTTLYRTVWLEKINRYFTYPLPAVFYYKRAKLVRWITGIDRVIIVELQAEPWGPKMIYETPLEEQSKSMDLEKFKEIIDYTQRTGFDEVYLWGAEWWYWLKEKHNNDTIWQEAQKLFLDK